MSTQNLRGPKPLRFNDGKALSQAPYQNSQAGYNPVKKDSGLSQQDIANRRR